MTSKFGALALEYCKVRLELMVLHSAAGFYIGTSRDDGPCSRESLEYFGTKAAATTALETGAWTQRSEP